MNAFIHPLMFLDVQDVAIDVAIDVAHPLWGTAGRVLAPMLGLSPSVPMLMMMMMMMMMMNNDDC